MESFFISPSDEQSAFYISSVLALFLLRKISLRLAAIYLHFNNTAWVKKKQQKKQKEPERMKEKKKRKRHKSHDFSIQYLMDFMQNPKTDETCK